MEKNPVAAGKSSFDLIDRENVFSAFDLKLDSVFVDLACGSGNYSRQIARAIGEKGIVYAIDLWEQGIQELDTHIRTHKIANIKTMVADISKKIPLAENSMDACLMATILHDLPEPDRKAAVREAGRLLKAGGVLNIIEFKKTDKGPGPPQKIRLDEKEVELLVSDCGFAMISGDEAGPFTYLLRFKKT